MVRPKQLVTALNTYLLFFKHVNGRLSLTGQVIFKTKLSKQADTLSPQTSIVTTESNRLIASHFYLSFMLFLSLYQ
jgi:hypothetical protein